MTSASPGSETSHADERLLKPEALRRVELFATLDDAELRGLAAHIKLRRLGKGELVVLKGSVSDGLMFLVSGSLQVIDYTEDGKEIGLNLFLPGNFFGELALIDGLPRSASVVAIEAATVAYLPKEYALRLIYGNPVVAESMFKHLARSIRRQSMFRSLLAIPNTRRRLFALLGYLKSSDGSGREVIENLPTQHQIAIMINTSRETVSRALAELQHKGILCKQSKVLLIARPDDLVRLAKVDGAEV